MIKTECEDVSYVSRATDICKALGPLDSIIHYLSYNPRLFTRSDFKITTAFRKIVQFVNIERYFLLLNERNKMPEIRIKIC